MRTKKEKEFQEVLDVLDNNVTYYDPPQGWKFGFPKVYNQRDCESVAASLERDGYPDKDCHWAALYTRFWKQDDFR